MMYPEQIVQPMRQELTRLGIEELRTAAEVDAKLQDMKGTALVIVNSVCGCAARNARPAVASAMSHTIKPDVSATVFAGQDREATERARQYVTGYAPSSPRRVQVRAPASRSFAGSTSIPRTRSRHSSSSSSAA